MWSAKSSSQMPTDPDRTARARIRDTAIDLFGRMGFGTSMRAIAAEAGVSPGLVLHHFGSKDNLRTVCDEHVLQEIRRSKIAAVTDQPSTGLLNALAEIDESVPLLGYIVRSLQSGGPLARDLVEHMVADAREYMRQGEATGMIKPSQEPALRDRYLVLQNLGTILVLAMEQTADGSPLDARRLMYDHLQAHALPALELYTHGLFTSDEMFETYRMHLSDQPDTPEQPSTSDGDTA